MAKIEIEVPEHVIAAELLEAAMFAETKKVRKALERSAAYYMPYDKCVDVFGAKKAKEYWNEC